VTAVAVAHEIKLSFAEIIVSGNAGVLRQVSALRDQLHDPDAHHRDPMDSHVAGAVAEYAASKYLGLPWNPAIGIRWAGEVDGDVRGIEVRGTSHPHGGLIGHDYSFNDRPYLLVLTHRSPTFTMRGWLWGHEIKQARFWRADFPRPAFLVPQRDLHPVETLPSA
jgi:hypothetical protein